jgi:superfamily II DNA or RNA helicase
MDMPPESVRRLQYDRGTLLISGSIRPPGEWPAGCWTWDARISGWRCNAIHYALVRQTLNPNLFDEVPPPARVAFSEAKLPVLRAEQKAALTAWTAAGGRGMIVMPTGTGKTEVALAAMRDSRVATLVVAPVRDLMHQWHRRILNSLGCDAGIVGDSLHSIKTVTVTTYDSAYIHMAELGCRFGLVIFDEAHHLPSRCYREAAEMCAAPLRMGLTATPQRGDGREADLDFLVGPVVYRQEINQARGKSLADYHVVRVPVKLNDEEQRLYDSAGRIVREFLAARRLDQKGYAWEDLCAESGKDPEARKAHKAFYLRKSIEDRAAEKLRVLEDLFRLHAGEPVLVFAGSNAMAFDVSRRFLVPTLLSHSRKAERRVVLEGFAAGKFPVLVANQVLDEGVDVPAAKVAVIIGGQASTRQAKQRLGRILRRSGEARAILYEVVCQETGEEERSRTRRRSDAYGTVRQQRGMRD